MKVEIDSSAFSEAVSWTTRIIPARPATPILTGVKLEAADGTLQLSAFDYEISARHHIEAGIDEDGTVVVQGKLLADIAKALPSGKTYLSTNGSKLTVSGGKSTFSLQLMPESDYPELPEIPSSLGAIDGDTFSHAIAQAAVAISREESRPVLTGVRVAFSGDKVQMTATDRFRLSRSTFTWSPAQDDTDTALLVRGNLLRDISRSLDTAQNVVLGFNSESPTLVSFTNAGKVSTTQLIDGEFPSVDRLFVSEYPIQAVIDKNALIDAIRRVSLVAERNAPIRMVFDNNEVTLSAGSADESQATEVIPVDMDGDPITIAFNPNYLLEGLGSIYEPYVRVKMVSPIKAVEFNGQQEQDGNESLDYRYLLVPVRFVD